MSPQKRYAAALLLCCMSTLYGYAVPDQPRIQQYAQLATTDADQTALAIQQAYAKLGFYTRAGHARHDALQGVAHRLDQDLYFVISVLESGPVGVIHDRRLDELVTPRGGNRLELAAESRRFIDGPDYFAYQAAWREEPYVGGIVEDFRATFGDVAAKVGGLESYDRYVAYEVTARFAGAAKTYLALVLRDSAGDQMKFLDSTVGPGILEECLRIGLPPLRADWETYIGDLAQERSQEPLSGSEEHARAEENLPGRVVCVDGFCCVDNRSNCGWESCHADASACGRQLEPLADARPALRPGALGCVAETKQASLTQPGNDSADHWPSGNHRASSTQKTVCTYAADCTQQCQVLSDSFWHDDDWLTTNVYFHNANTRRESVDGTKQCSANNTVVFFKCLLGIFCDTTITVTKKDVLGVEFTFSGQLWSLSHSVAHTCLDPKPDPPPPPPPKKKRVRKVCRPCGTAVAPKVSNNASVGTLAFDTLCEDVPDGELGYDTCEQAALAEPDPTCDSCTSCNFNGFCDFGESAATCPDCQTGCNSNFSCEPWRGENEWNCVDCQSSCIPCQGMTCGTDWLCGGAFCGSCFPGETCNSFNRCESTSVCDPCHNAVGAACGWMWSSDCGRMADCGCAAPGEICQNGQCVYSGGGGPGGGDDGLPDRWGCNCWGQTWDCSWSELISLWDAFCLEEGGVN